MQDSHENVISYASLSNAELVLLAQRRDLDAYRQIMRRGNQRLFRIARSVLNDDSEAEDAVQEAWLRAFSTLDCFRGEADLLTWATRIVLNECYDRIRHRHSAAGHEQIEEIRKPGGGAPVFLPRFDPDDAAAETPYSPIRQVLERAIASLPDALRVVFVMHDVEDCSIEEAAGLLDIAPETVEARLHHARRLLQRSLHDALSDALAEAFPFLGRHCEWMNETVLAHMLAKRGFVSSEHRGELTCD